MAESFGKAKLEILVDLEKLKAELKQALSMANSSMSELKSTMSSNSGDTSACGNMQSCMTETGNKAKSTGESVKSIGEHGAKSIDTLMKFEVVRGTIDSVKQAFMSVKDSVMDSTREYASSELSVEKLRGGLDRLGSGNYFDKLLNQANDLHKLTPFDDDDITNMQSMLTTFGMTGDQIESITPKMLDLASAFAQGSDTGMDLTQTAILVGKATGADMVTAMQRVGVIMTDTQKKMFEAASGMERINILSEILAQNGNITAEAFGKTLAGQLKISDNAFKDMKETIGKAFAPVVREVLTIIQSVADVFQQLPPELQAGAGALIIVTAAATALIPVLVALDVELAGIPLIIGAVVAGIGILYEVLTNFDAIKEFVTEMVGGEEVINELRNTLSELYDDLKEVWDIISNEVSDAFTDLKQEALDVWQSFTDLFGGSENLLDILKTMGKDGLIYIKDILITVIDTISRVIRTIAETIESNNKWLGSTNKTGEGLGSLKFLVDGAVSGIQIMIEVVGRATQTMFGLYNALVGMGSLNVYDLIFDKGKFDQNLDKFKLGLEQVKDAFSKSVKEKFGSEVLPTYGPTLDHPIPGQPKEETNTSGKTPKKEKGSGSDKTSDPYKEENESLKELMGNYEHLLKLKDNEITKGEATLADRNEVVGTYIQEMQAIYDGLSNKENRSKVEEKISELTTKQYEDIKKAGEEQKKLVDDVDKFVSKRTEKTLSGVAKETAEIENAYRSMYEKIEKSAIDASEKEFLKKQLDVQKEQELHRQMEKYDEQLNTELKMAMMKNSEDTYNLDIYNINEKYNKERKRILDNYTDSESRRKLLQQNEISRARELEKIQTEGEQRVVSLMQSGFESVTGLINAEFSKMWESVFGEANSLFEAFMKKVLDSLLELAATSFFKLILSTLTGGAFGIISSAIGGSSGGGGGGFDAINSSNISFGTFDIRKYLPEIPDVSIPNISMPDLPAIPSLAKSKNNINIGGSNISVNSLKLSEKDWIDMIDNEIIPQIKGHLIRTGKTILDNQ